jgi:hypothetical protein
MENEIFILSSKKGSDFLVVKKHKFRHIRQRADGNNRWRCCKKQCTCTVLMTSDNKIMIEIVGEHNHLVDSTQKIEKQVLRENCKRKATSSIATRPIKIIRSQLMNSVSIELE